MSDFNELQNTWEDALVDSIQFDDIFAATDYTKALDAIKAYKLDKAKDIRLLAAELETLWVELCRHISPPWPQAEDPPPAGPDGRTIHVAISPLALGSDESTVEFQCYDLGGQQKSYAAAQQAYVAPGALYLLVVSAEAATTPSHEERLRWWLHFLQTNAPGAVVQPVLTHADKCATEAEADERKAKEDERIERRKREKEDNSLLDAMLYGQAKLQHSVLSAFGADAEDRA